MDRDGIGHHLTQFSELPDTPDHILVVLKGHLLVERGINLLLEAKLHNPDALKLRKTNGPKFFHKVSLLKALIPKPEPIKLWAIVEKLNTLRNKFAHNLSPDNIAKEIDKFTDDADRVFARTKKADDIEKSIKKKMQRNRINAAIIGILLHLTYLEEDILKARKAART